MTRFAQFKFVVAVAGIVVFGYGVRVDSARTRLAGMVILLAAFAMRMFPRAWRDRIDGVPPGPTDTDL